MSVGKPIRSGKTEKRPRNCGRVQGRTGGPTAKGQGRPVCLHDQTRPCLLAAELPWRSDGSMDRPGRLNAAVASTAVDRPSDAMNGPKARRPQEGGRFFAEFMHRSNTHECNREMTRSKSRLRYVEIVQCRTRLRGRRAPSALPLRSTIAIRLGGPAGRRKVDSAES